MISELKKIGAEVDYYDPWIPEYRKDGNVTKGIKEISPLTVSGYDLIMITTAHTDIDYQMIIDNAQAVFDTKNVTKSYDKKNKVEIL